MDLQFDDCMVASIREALHPAYHCSQESLAHHVTDLFPEAAGPVRYSLSYHPSHTKSDVFAQHVVCYACRVARAVIGVYQRDDTHGPRKSRAWSSCCVRAKYGRPVARCTLT